MTVEIEVVADPAAACAERLSAAAASGGHVVLTGGSTPARAYSLCASEHHASAWNGARIWFSDERCVEPASELSNYGLVTRTLLDPLEAAGVSVEFCRRVMGEQGYEAGGDDYEQALREAGFDGSGGAAEFELALLGIGGDGHICSMFPGQRSLGERSRLAVGVPIAGLEPFVPRVTLTFPALAHAKRVLVLATGAGKADAVSAAFADDAPAVDTVPASLLREHVENVTVLLDDAAASRL